MYFPKQTEKHKNRKKLTITYFGILGLAQKLTVPSLNSKFATNGGGMVAIRGLVARFFNFSIYPYSPSRSDCYL